jgi:hypothetical protein
VHEQLMMTRHFDADASAHVSRVSEHQLRWQQALGEQAARPVKVGEHGVQQPRPLHQSSFEHLPIGRGDHQRQGVQTPEARLQAVAGRFLAE